MEDLAALDARLTWWQPTFSTPKDAPGPSTPADPVDVHRVVDDLKEAFHQSTDLIIQRMGVSGRNAVLRVSWGGMMDRARVAWP